MDAPQEPKQMSFVASFFYIMLWMIGVVIGWPITLLLRRKPLLQKVVVVLIGCVVFGAVYLTSGDNIRQDLAKEQAAIDSVQRSNDDIEQRNAAARRAWIPVEANFNRFVTENSSGNRVPLFSFYDPVATKDQDLVIKGVDSISVDQDGRMYLKMWVSRDRTEADGGGWTYYTTEPSWLWDEQLKKAPTPPQRSFSPYWGAFWNGYFAFLAYYWLMKWLFWSAEQARQSRAANLAMRAAKAEAAKG